MKLAALSLLGLSFLTFSLLLSLSSAITNYTVNVYYDDNGCSQGKGEFMYAEWAQGCTAPQCTNNTNLNFPTYSWESSCSQGAPALNESTAVPASVPFNNTIFLEYWSNIECTGDPTTIYGFTADAVCHFAPGLFWYSAFCLHGNAVVYDGCNDSTCAYCYQITGFPVLSCSEGYIAHCPYNYTGPLSTGTTGTTAGTTRFVRLCPSPVSALLSSTSSSSSTALSSTSATSTESQSSACQLMKSGWMILLSWLSVIAASVTFC